MKKENGNEKESFEFRLVCGCGLDFGIAGLWFIPSAAFTYAHGCVNEHVHISSDSHCAAYQYLVADTNS
jgi:hypothetical protein